MSRPDAARFVARVEGRVQGVGYRYFVQSRAEELRLGGSVRNMPNRSVRVEAEGPREVLEALIEILREGPPGARVDCVDVEWLPPTGVGQFRIEAG
ncbi:MAG TPA: acylphosphatase [Candidatus Eisenbacteria bacterium]